MRTTHILKSTPFGFKGVWDGRKPFEIRANDREFQTGDELILRECQITKIDGEPDRVDYSGRAIHVPDITYILAGGRFGLGQHYCVLGFTERICIDDYDAVFGNPA